MTSGWELNGCVSRRIVTDKGRLKGAQVSRSIYIPHSDKTRYLFGLGEHHTSAVAWVVLDTIEPDGGSYAPMSTPFGVDIGEKRNVLPWRPPSSIFSIFPAQVGKKRSICGKTAVLYQLFILQLTLEGTKN